MTHKKIIYKCNGKKCECCKKCGYTTNENFKADDKKYGIFHFTDIQNQKIEEIKK